jgi:hypothetical protein
MNEGVRVNFAGHTIGKDQAGNPIVSVIKKNGNDYLKGDMAESRRGVPRQAIHE